MLILIVLPLTVWAQAAAPRWWDDTVWYEIFVRSFYDSDGDGIGDLQGVIQKLDYLNDGDPTTTTDLGITGIWLMPIMTSPSYHGYDVTDYYSVDPDYGTKEDFLALMDAAHARGIKVIVDMVLNHTSSQHEWFQQAAAGNAEYRDWYVWSDTNPNYTGPWGQPVWYRKNEAFYYAAFWSEMPDLNFKNPAVIAEARDITAFWLTEMQVDGFRLDAIKYVVEDEVEGRRLLEDSPLNRQVLADLRQHVKSINPEAFIVGEIWDSTVVIDRYMDDGSVDVAFEFNLAEDILNATRAANRRDFERQVNTLVLNYGNQFAPFTTNHDQTRLMTMLNGNIAANKAAATLLLTIPGTPFIYYGEEIGMTGDKPDELLRTPMQWDNTPINGGFSTTVPWQALTGGFSVVNVAAQTDDPASLLSHYRALIHLRNSSPALRSSNFLTMDKAFRSVSAYLRYTDEEILLVLVNLDDVAVSGMKISLDAGPLAGVTQAETIFGNRSATAPNVTANGGFVDYTPVEALEPFETVIVRLR
jgi:glycosidase